MIIFYPPHAAVDGRFNGIRLRVGPTDCDPLLGCSMYSSEPNINQLYCGYVLLHSRSGCCPVYLPACLPA